MSREHNSPELLSEFLSYLVNHEQAEDQSLPSLADLSQELGIGIAALREQLEVARALGLVEVRPRIGIRRKAYSFCRPSAKAWLTPWRWTKLISRPLPTCVNTSR